MNILWDLRLFSFGYGNRGVGRFTEALSGSISFTEPEYRIIGWGDKSKIPCSLQKKIAQWIPYRQSDWKRDLFTIPLIILRHKIDLYHYWVALGPKRQIGLGLLHPCPSVATVYDMGVEYWDIPFLRSVKSSRYWRMQKILAGSLKSYICISESARLDFIKAFPDVKNRCHTLYMPVSRTNTGNTDRKPYFVMLGGSVHKNCARVVKAFSQLGEKYPQFKLLILGDVDKKEEGLENVPETVLFESGMERYQYHLDNCSGLIFCSLYEGLGIPPLEAMVAGCPVVASRIPSVEETCTESARFVDPMHVEGISLGISDLIENNSLWAERSRMGAGRYRMISIDSGDKCIEIYKKLINR